MSASYRIEAAFVCQDGKFTIVGGDESALCYCDLWADIQPTPFGDGDFEIIAVYAGSQCTDLVEQLSGEAEKTAIAILEASEEWLQCAREDASKRLAA